MIVSHRYKFIFIAVTKTGSTSIQHALVGHIKGFKRPLEDNIDVEKDDFIGGLYQKSSLYTHIPAVHLRRILGAKIWDSYFKFAFARNPWDANVSAYFFKRANFAEKIKKGEALSPHERQRGEEASSLEFSDWLRKRRRPAIHHFIGDENGKILVDFVGRFENLKEDFGKVCRKIGMPGLKLPHEHKTKHLHYSAYYNEETRKFTTDRYKKDITTFGYRFEKQDEPLPAL